MKAVGITRITLMPLILSGLGHAFTSDRLPIGRSDQEHVAHHQLAVFAKKPDPRKLLVSSDPIVLRQQAEMLREEARAMETKIREEKEEALVKQNAKIDKWIDDLLIKVKINEDTDMLNDEEQVAQLMQDGRFSAENINMIFDRICELSQRRQSIDNCSPLISLLLDAACKVDCLEKEENPNKRWNHRVERDLRKKLFAMGWGINIDEVRKNNEVRSITGEKDFT